MAVCLCMLYRVSIFSCFFYLTQGLSAHVMDIAPEGKASQSSALDADSAASLANDDSPSTCSRTVSERHPWFVLDMGRQRTVNDVIIHNAGEMTAYRVYMNRTQNSRGSLCAFYQAGHLSRRHNMKCNGPTTGQYLTIQPEYTGSLVICQIEVHECAAGFFGSNCTNECRCRGSELCSRSTGYCPSGCMAGWEGRGCQKPCNQGRFGIRCRKQCHCQFNPACDGATGKCPGRCADGWLADDCQTELPRLTETPGIVHSLCTDSSITLRWRHWSHPVAPSLHLQYHVLYTQDAYHGRQVWTSGPTRSPVAHTNELYQQLRVAGLKRNTFYRFRVIPYLLRRNEKIRGVDAGIAGPFRTNCSAPDAPEIVALKPGSLGEDENAHATFFIKWKPIKGSGMHCDSISHYKVVYKTTSGPWRDVIAGSQSHSMRVASLDFNTDYRVKVVAINNKGLRAPSDTQHFVTPVAVVRSSGLSVWMIAAIVVACLLFLIVLVICIVCYRRYSKKYSTVPQKENSQNGPIQLNNYSKGGLIDKESTPTADSGVGVGDSPDSLSHNSIAASPMMQAVSSPGAVEQPKRSPIALDDLEEYVLAGLDNDKETLYAEYMEIREVPQDMKQHGRNIGNKHKNRFVNIIPYDHSRVVLDKLDNEPDSDYINASYIDGYQKPKHYIAAQGCNKFTIQDMWRMTWQVDSRRIVMATNLVENGRRKCEQYWPDVIGEEKDYGMIKVRLVDVEQTADFYQRTFDISQCGETRNIKQLHFTSWPDHGIPTRAGPILALRKKVRSFDESHPGPIIIHCSAGVGRTGSFIAIDYLLDCAHAEKNIDLFALTQQMRRSRVCMIQTAEQYVFVYTALVEALFFQDTAIACFQFRKVYAELCQVNAETNKSKLQEQFETLQALPPKVLSSDCQTGSAHENQHKNRFANILPADRHRPYLMTRVRGTNDYINAVFLDGHRSRNAYIITQFPLPHTVIDFWRMVYEHKCGSVVMLNTWNDKDQSYGQYWPDDETCECGPFIIEPIYVDRSNSQIKMVELKLTYQPDQPLRASTTSTTSAEDVTISEPSTTLAVHQFQLQCWPSDSALPRNSGEDGRGGNVLIALSQLIEKSQLKTGNGPILIHCHDGVRQSGLYATISCIWEKMKLDQEVDIFQTVKQHRYHRLHIVQDMAQYQFCYEMVLAYLSEFDTYSNFR